MQKELGIYKKVKKHLLVFACMMIVVQNVGAQEYSPLLLILLACMWERLNHNIRYPRGMTSHIIKAI